VLVASGGWILTEPITLLFPGVSGRLRAVVLDVGHADAVLVQLPDRRSLLVDAGGSITGSTFDVGGRVVAPALWALGTRRLDALILSHGDPDHVGGAAAVMRDFRPREVWEGIPVPRSAPLGELHDLAARVGARWRQRRAGDVVRFGDVVVRVWHPAEAEWERQKVRNDDSLVVELRYHDVSLVLPGDIGRDVERRLAPSITPARLRILKVPHHGSATSSSEEFLAAFRPTVAIVSAASTTRVSDQVLARYRAAGAAVFRTSDDGAVTVTTDGTGATVEAFTGRRLTIRTTELTKDTKKTPSVGVGDPR
jgi:competence protein ComEC